MWKNSFLILTVTFVFFGCKPDEQEPYANPTQIRTYFPLSEFIGEQIELLAGTEVEKELLFNEEAENTRQRLDVDNWRAELDWFVQMDINKASLATAYEIIEEGEKTTYRLKEGEKSALKEMVVRFDGEQVREVSLVAQEGNTFYESHTEAKLSTDQSSGILDHYQLQSRQKVWFLSPNHLQVKGRVEK